MLDFINALRDENFFFSNNSEISISRMTSTLRLVKYFLFVIGYILLCSILVIVKKNQYFAIGNLTIEILKNNNLIFHNDNNSVENIYFEDEAIVRLDELEKGIKINEKEVVRKLRRIEQICEKYNETSLLKKNNFLYSPKHRALYCWIRKVGSTSFTKFFGELRERRGVRNYYREIKFLAPETIEQLKNLVEDKEVFKFLIVRHPFERLVSSYRDRIEDNSRYTAQAWIYAPRIFHSTRPELFRANGTGGNGLLQIFNIDRRLKLIPTFDEFIAWLLKELPENDDVHWYQYNKHCSLCSIKFDYVLKLENYTSNDINYIFEKLGLREKFTYLPKLHSSRNGTTNFATTCKYFANLPREIIHRLYERYKIDFEMFDYEYENYLPCSKKRTTSS